MCVADGINKARTQIELSPIYDHQIILVGANPLPCYVAALALNPQKVTLLCSSDTFKFAENIKNALDKSKDVEIKELTDPDSCSEICSVVSGIIGNSSAGIHYTGGMKTMSVHAHREWLEKTKNISQASYINAQKIALVFDGTDVEIDLKKKPSVRFDTIVNLHNLQPISASKPAYKKALDVPGLAGKMRECVNRLGIDDFYKIWRPFIECQEIGSSKKHRIDIEKDAVRDERCLKHSILELTEIKGFFDTHYNRAPDSGYTFEQFARDYFGYPDSPLPARPGKEKLEDAYKWIDGVWLEEYTWVQLDKISKDVRLHNVVYDINMIKPPERQFQADVACIRGHTLFFFSCTTARDKGLQKHKLFEAQVRAQQLGGDHARYALVCLGDPGRVVELEEEAKEDWGSQHVKVFGWEQVMGDFAQSLRNWINKI